MEGIDTLRARWLPFVLITEPMDDDDGFEPRIAELRQPADGDWWKADGVQVWTVNAVLRNFAYQAAHWHVIASRAGTNPRRAASYEELRQWTASTRSLASRLPFTGSAEDRMVEAAAAVERAITWRDRFFSRYPKGTDTKQDAHWRASMSLWAMNYLLRAVNEIEAADAPFRTATFNWPPTKFWPAMFDWLPADAFPDVKSWPFDDYKAAQQRAVAFEETIKDDGLDALMTDLLRSVIHRGHFGPDGQLRTPASDGISPD